MPNAFCAMNRLAIRKNLFKTIQKIHSGLCRVYSRQVRDNAFVEKCRPEKVINAEFPAADQFSRQSFQKSPVTSSTTRIKKCIRAGDDFLSKLNSGVAGENP